MTNTDKLLEDIKADREERTAADWIIVDGVTQQMEARILSDAKKIEAADKLAQYVTDAMALGTVLPNGYGSELVDAYRKAGGDV